MGAEIAFAIFIGLVVLVVKLYQNTKRRVEHFLGLDKKSIKRPTTPPVRPQPPQSALDDRADQRMSTERASLTHSDTGNAGGQLKEPDPEAQQSEPASRVKGSKVTAGKDSSGKVNLFLCDGIDFSHNPAAQFSLKLEMNRAGFRDVGDFLKQLAQVAERPTSLLDLSQRMGKIRNRDVFRTVTARLLQASSYNSAKISKAQISEWYLAAGLAGLGGDSDKRLSESFMTTSREALTASIRTEGLQGMTIVEILHDASDAWEPAESQKTKFGDDAEVARVFLSGLVLLSLLHSLRSRAMSQNVIESLSGTKSATISLREEMHLMTNLGRAYAKAKGIDYDEYVRRHLGAE